jgi:hypothetical protein
VNIWAKEEVRGSAEVLLMRSLARKGGGLAVRLSGAATSGSELADVVEKDGTLQDIKL